MILTHPNWGRTPISLNTQKEMAAIGVFIEKISANIKQGWITEERMAAEIREIGSARIIMSTDRGQADQEFPVIEYANYIRMMLKQGLSKTQIREMTSYVPEYLTAE